MKRFFSTIVSLAVFASLVVIPVASAVSVPATNANVGQALEIAPPLLNLTANPGDTVQTKISLRDISPTSLVVTGAVNDFTSDGEEGIPKITLDANEANPYSLKPWIAAPGSMTLKSKQIQNLPITINVPKNAAPGGYYGVIRFSAAAPDMDTSGVALSASLGALIFLRVNGQANESMAIQDFNTVKDGSKSLLYESSPLDFVLRIKNTGNVFEQPVGQISITDSFGNKVANVNVNLEQRNVLPQTTRKFTAPLDKATIGDRVLFGHYTAKIKVTYAGNKVVTAETGFWVIPYKLIAGAIIGIVALVLGIRYLVKRYNRHLINKAGGRSRRR